jgi:F-type H+-transporting ATPase subunit epsilon
MFKLEIATPEKIAMSEEVSAFTAAGVSGEFGALPGHAPFLTRLKIGKASYNKNDIVEYLVLGEGFAEITGTRVICLVRTAEKTDEIDVERAEASRKRAEERLKKVDDPDIDYKRAWVSLQRALVRLEMVSKE